MSQLDAQYLDGRSTRPHAVTVHLDAAGVRIDGVNIHRSENWANIEKSERTRHGPRRLTFQDGAYLDVDDRRAFDDVLAQLGHRDSLVVGLQMSWKATLASFMALLAVLAMAYRWGLPWAAQELAQSIPISVEQQLGESAFEQLDARWLKPSKLDPQHIERLQQRFEAAVRAQPQPSPAYRLVFRTGGPLQANALALPGGILVVTDELVALAPDDDAILGVLAHELGHVQHRHVTASIIQASGLSMVAFVLWGDVSTLLAAAPVALMQATYSRESETQADTYAIHFIQAAGLRSASVAELFEAMQKQNGEEGGSVWSSHPDTGERAERFRRR